MGKLLSHAALAGFLALTLASGCGGSSVKSTSAAPTLDYTNASGTTGKVGTAMSIIPTTLKANGSPVTACGVKPGTTALPSGLGVDATTCVISGTPTITAAASYAIVATNSVGSSAGASVTLSIAANVPVLSYAGATGTTGAVNVTMLVAPTTLDSGGSALTACHVTPALPAGLSLDATTCVISGTPTATSANATYQVTATNAAGSSAPATLSLTVDARVPSLSYTGATGTTGKVGTAMSVSPTTLAANGAPVTSCASVPALPSGLSLNASTCVISGTPTRATASATYTLTATNSVGASAGAAVSLTIQDVPDLDYTGATGTTGVFGVPMAISPTTLTANNAAVTGCTVTTGTLPTGLSMNGTTCVISGTPAAVGSGTLVGVTATNAAGSSAEAQVTITVVPNVPHVSFAGATGTTGAYKGSMTVTPTLNTGGTSLITCEIKPGTTPLPSGLGVDPATCTLSGSPTTAIPPTQFVVVAQNSAGFSPDALVTLTVNPAPPTLSYAPLASALTVGAPVNIVPTLATNGGALTGCATKSSTPTLPAGLSVNPATCVISGTPTAVTVNATYTLSATNAGGTSADATLAIQVKAGVPTLSYVGSTNTTVVQGTAFNVSPTVLNENGDPGPYSCSITSGTLPSGWTLSVNANTCVISGTPTSTLSATTYTVVATNNTGSSTAASVTLSVITGPSAPTLTYAAPPYVDRINQALTITPVTFSSNGASTTCALAGSSPALPAGLSVNSSTCVVSGTPTTLATNASYSVTATNSQGPTTASFSLTVADVPALAYASSTTTGTVNTPLTVSPTSLLANNAPITGCDLKAGTSPLPAGLAVDPASCAVTGTPTSVSPTTTYTVVATNAIGSSSAATLSLGVAAAKPSLSYAASTGTTGTYGHLMSVVPSTFSGNGASVTACAVTSGTLPAGVTVDNNTCIISGTPTATLATASLTLTATNSSGSTAATVSLTVNADVPTLSYATSGGTTGTYGQAMTVLPSTLLANGAAVTACGIKNLTPGLPAGLSVASTTCAISGTPTQAVSGGVYTLVATNSAGSSADATVTLTVNALPPTLIYPSSVPPLKVGVPATVSTATFATNGAALSSCTVAPSAAFAAVGLSIDSTTCTLSGTPTGTLASTLFTVTATNSGGSTPATVTLTVIDKPVISYPSATQRGFVGTALSVAPSSVNTNFSPITSCLISPALPSGLGISSTSTPPCTLSGTPTGALVPTQYTVNAVNAAGTSAAATVTLRVDTPASLSFSDGASYNYGGWSSTTSTDHVFVVTNTGGAPATSLATSGSLATGFSFKPAGSGSYPGFGGSCGSALAGGAQCTLVATFGPVAANSSPYTGTLGLSYQTGVGSGSASISLSGTSVSNAVLAITDNPPAYYTLYGLPADPATYSFGTVAVGTAVDHTFYVSNNGGGTATVSGGTALSTPFSYKGGNFPGTGGTCSGPLSAGTTCTVVVTYTGSASPASSSFAVNYTGGSSSSTPSRAISGTGTSGPALTLYDYNDGHGNGINAGPFWNFGSIGMGGFGEKDFVVINSGASAATGLTAGTMATGFSYPGGFPGATTGTQSNENGFVYCGSTLAAGGLCAIKVHFTPTQSIVYSGNIAVSYGSSSSSTRAVQGAGTQYAVLSIRADTQHGGPALAFDYGLHATGSSTTQVFLLTNGGGASTTSLSGAALGTGFQWSGSGHAFPGDTGTYQTSSGSTVPFCSTSASLNPGNSCALSVDFAPSTSSATPVTFTTSLAVSYGDGSGATQNVSQGLQGKASNSAIITLQCDHCNDTGSNPRVDNLGLQAASSSTTSLILVSNTGTTGSVLSSPAITNTTGLDEFTFPGGYPGGSGTAQVNGTTYSFCGASGTSLPNGQSCLLKVKYAAPATPGTQTETLTLATATASAANVQLTLTGTSTNQGIVSISDCPNCGGGGNNGPPTHDFGYVAVGSQNVVYLFLQNAGATSATVLDDGFSDTSLTYAGNGGAFPGGTPGSAVNLLGRSYNYCSASPAALAANATCVVAVQYSAGTAPEAGTLTLGLSGATTPQLLLNITGIPTSGPILSLSSCVNCSSSGGSGTPTFDFGVVAAGKTFSQYFVLSNTGLAAAPVSGTPTVTVTDANGNASEFQWANGGAFPGGSGTASLYGQVLPFCSTTSIPAAGSPGSTCVMQVQYTASSGTRDTATLNLSFNGGAVPSALSYNLRGEPTSSAILHLSECPRCGGDYGNGAPLHDFGTVASGSAFTQYFVLSNTGLAAAPLSSSPTVTVTDSNGSATEFQWANGGAFPGGSGTASVDGQTLPYCGTTSIPATGTSGSLCVVQVQYTASTGTLDTATLSLSFGGGAVPSSLSYNLQGEPTSAPIMHLTQCPQCGSYGGGTPTQDFGPVAAGSTSAQYFVVSNTGLAAAPVSGTPAVTVTDANGSATEFQWANGGVFPGGSGTANVNGQTLPYCSTTSIPATGTSGSMCVVQVQYTASSGTLDTATLSLSFGGGAVPSSLSYNLQGEPTSNPIMRISECTECGGNYGGGTPTHDFGLVAAGSTDTQYFVISNTGLAAAPVSGTPNVTVTDSNGSATELQWANGSAFPGGSGTANVNGQTLPYCSTTSIPAGGSPGSTCVVEVQYTASSGTLDTATLSISFGNNAQPATLSYFLQGEPTSNPIMNISQCSDCGGNFGGGTPTQDFGLVASGSTTTQYFVVSNSGLAAASVSGTPAVTVTDSNGSATEFQWANGGAFPGGSGTTNFFGPTLPYCSTTSIPAGGSSGSTCVVEVQYTASSGTLDTATLSISFGNNAQPATVSYFLQGEPTSNPIMRISQCPQCGGYYGGGTPTQDFGLVASGSTLTQYFVVTNTGLAAAPVSGTPTVTVTDSNGSATEFQWANGGVFPGGSGTTSFFGPTLPYCSTTSIPAGGSSGSTCVVEVQYTASSGTLDTATLSISFGNNAHPATVSHKLQGEPTGQAILAFAYCPTCGGGTTMGQDFGTVPTGKTLDQWIFVTNNGNSAATVATGAVTDLNTGGGTSPVFDWFGGAGYPGGTAGASTTVYSYATHFCPALGNTLAAHSNCVIHVQYHAQGTTQETGQAVMTFTGAASGTGTLTANLQGEPTNLAMMTINPCGTCGGGGTTGMFDFMSQPTNHTYVGYFWINNTGNGTATLTGAQVQSNGANDVATTFDWLNSVGYPGGTAGSAASGPGAGYNFCPALLGSFPGNTQCVVAVEWNATGTLQQIGQLSLNFSGAASGGTLSYQMQGEPY
jgi:hypothetical protein